MEPYVYNAIVNYVHDGDTINVNLDKGLDDWRHKLGVRFLGCNAAELGTPGGDAAAVNLQALLPAGTQVVVRSVKWDKYANRIDADVIELDGTDLIQKLIAEGWLAPWDGTGPRPVPPWPRPTTSARKKEHHAPSPVRSERVHPRQHR